MKVGSDTWNDFHVKSFSFSIPYVDPDIAGNKLDETYMLQFSWHWPWDDESILPIVTSIVHTTTVSVMNTAISGLPDCSWKVRELWGYCEEPNGDCGPF
jgi:hypothetical protein